MPYVVSQDDGIEAALDDSALEVNGNRTPARD
jgi:hypothetical protein